MEHLYILLNSIVLIFFGRILWVQENTISTLKTNIDAIDIRKVKEAKELIVESVKENHKVELDKAKVDIAKEVFNGYQSANSEFLEKNQEIVIFLVQILAENGDAEQRKILSMLPKNREDLATYLLKYKAGILVGESSATK